MNESQLQNQMLIELGKERVRVYRSVKLFTRLKLINAMSDFLVLRYLKKHGEGYAYAILGSTRNEFGTSVSYATMYGKIYRMIDRHWIYIKRIDFVESKPRIIVGLTRLGSEKLNQIKHLLNEVLKE